MARRASTRNAPRQETPPVEAPVAEVAPLAPLTILRWQWKWAAFSQFFFTFNHLFNMPDVSLIQIEQDLVNETHVVIPRIMQRLLFTISYDRKITLDNWQTALRKQYRKREPAANPIGAEPRVEFPEEPASSPPPEDSVQIPELKVEDFDKDNEQGEPHPAASATATDRDVENNPPYSTRASTLEPTASVKGTSVQPSEIDSELPSTRYASVGGDAMENEGEEEESKNWLELPMLEKLDSMHLLTEWQFQSPMRLRQLMRTDDELATWRIEPIGYDAKHNAYWLIGTDRLWIQRPLPKPPKPKKSTKSLKRKRAPAKNSKSKATGKAVSKSGNETATTPAAKRPRLAKEKEEEEEPAGRGRAAKAQAKTKLEQQAAQLAATKKEIEMEARRVGTRGSPRKAAASVSAPPPPRGTRASRRLRGKTEDGEDEEWQAVPDEWLNGGKEVNGGKIATRSQAARAGLESEGSEISDLTELSEENGAYEAEDDEEVAEEDDQEPEEEEEKPQPEELALPGDFIEWETIAVTLYEWEHVADPFEKATHYLEKALYKVLVNDLVPPITEELRETERKGRLEAALNHRKRSSRLLLRQSMKEEAEVVARKQAEEEEKNSRTHRQQVRAEKQEDARAQRELAREQRRREREEREERERLERELADQKEKERQERLANGIKDEDKGKSKPARSRSRKSAAARQNGRQESKSGSRTPGEEWEVDCEICHRRGRNIDDGVPMMSCGTCSKWQHIPCHDAADQQAGKRKRNWNTVDFVCRQCQLSTAAHHPQARYDQMQMPPSRSPQGQNPYAHLVSGTSGYPVQPNQYTNSIGSVVHHSSYPATSMNGRSVYTRDHRTVPGEHAIQQQPMQYDQQPYGGVSFTHYQPHLQEFSANPQAYSSHTRAYGHNQASYPHYPSIGSHHQYQAQWAQSTSYHQVSSQRHSSADAAPSAGTPQPVSQSTSYSAQYWQQQPSQPQTFPPTFEQPQS